MTEQQIIRCPVGCAFLYSIERDNVPIETAVRPRDAFRRLAKAHVLLSPWGIDFDKTAAELLARGPRWAELAKRLLGHAGSGWWADPIDLERQVLLTDPALRPSRQNLRWESYAQRPTVWQATSTERDGTTSLNAAIWYGAGDWPIPASLLQHRALIDSAARVLEIGGPSDWHSLCAKYPRRIETGEGPANNYTLSPDWRSVRQDWDGIHISFMAQLVAPFVAQETEHGTSMMWAWQSEATLWVSRDAVHRGEEIQKGT